MTPPPPDPDLEWWQQPLQRPSSVTVAGGILWALCGLALLGACLFGVLAATSSSHVSARFGVGWIVVIFIAIGIVDGLLAYNVMHGKQWARITAITFGTVNIALSIAAILQGAPSACLSIALQAVIIGTLMTTAAGAYFRNPT